MRDGARYRLRYFFHFLSLEAVLIAFLWSSLLYENFAGKEFRFLELCRIDSSILALCLCAWAIYIGDRLAEVGRLGLGARSFWRKATENMKTKDSLLATFYEKNYLLLNLLFLVLILICFYLAFFVVSKLLLAAAGRIALLVAFYYFLHGAKSDAIVAVDTKSAGEVDDKYGKKWLELWCSMFCALAFASACVSAASWSASGDFWLFPHGQKEFLNSLRLLGTPTLCVFLLFWANCCLIKQMRTAFLIISIFNTCAIFILGKMLANFDLYLLWGIFLAIWAQFFVFYRLNKFMTIDQRRFWADSTLIMPIIPLCLTR